MTKKLGATFHRTFTLLRSSVAQILRVSEHAVQAEMRSLPPKIIRERTNLGTIYVAAMPQYGLGTGLLDDNKLPTIFGHYAYKYDPMLEGPGTQWLMHYFMSSPYGSGPTYWHELVVKYFRSGNRFTRAEVEESIKGSFSRTQGKHVKSDWAGETGRAFLGSYTKPDGLGLLGILSTSDNGDFSVAEPDSPPTWAVACALVHFWQTQYSSLATINLKSLYGEAGLTALFMISQGRINMMLEEMQEHGMLQLHMIAPPYQVALVQRDMEFPLKMLYGVKHP